MFSFLLAFGLANANICFYQDSITKCPDSYLAFSVNEFNKFKEQQFTDDNFIFYFTTNMNSDCVIDFSNIVPSTISVSFLSAEITDPLHKVYLDFSHNKAFNVFRAEFIDVVPVSQDTNSKFSNVILQYSHFSNLDSLVADRVVIDAAGLSTIKEIIADDFLISITPQLEKCSTKISSNSPENANVIFNLMYASQISVIDTTVVIGEISFNFEKTNFKDISFLLNLTTGTTSFQAVTHSSQTNFPPFHFELGTRCNLHFVNSNLPIISSPQGQIYASITGSGTIELENENAPFSIDCQQLTVKLYTPKVTLFGPLFIRDSVKIITNSLDNADLYLSSVILASKSNSVFDSDSKINVHIGQLQSLLNNTNCNFAGSQVTYTVTNFPETEISTIHFSNLLISNETKYTVNYILGQSSLLSIDSVKGSDSLRINANFIGSSPSESEVKDHLKEELSLVELKENSLTAIIATFPRYNIKGFNSATHIYSSQISGTKLTLLLDHELGDYNNYLCINGTESCPEGSVVFPTANDFEANWVNYLRETAEDIYFYFRSQYGKIVNFTTFIQNNNHPHVYFESAILILSQDYIQGELGPITINGSVKGTQVVIDRKVSPVMLISPLEFNNVMIAAHSIETINCTLLPYLKVDPIALSKYPQKCAPNYLILDGFDSYTKFDFKPKSVVLNGDDDSVSQVTLQINDKSLPHVNLTTKANSVSFTASEDKESEVKDDSKKFLSVFSKFEMTSQNQVINSNLSADYFDGLIDVHNFNGLLNVVNSDGKVPLKFTDTKELSVKSEVNVEELNYFSINGKVDLTKSDVSSTFSDVHFGPDFQLVDSEKSQLRIRKGYFDSRTKQNVDEINGQLVLDGSLFVNSSTTVHSKSFKIDSSSENPTITISYRLSEIPYVNFGSLTAAPKTKIVFQYDESDRYGQFNEAEFTKDFAKKFYSETDVPVICAKELKCSDLDVTFVSSIPQFNGDTSVLGSSCKSVGDQQCLALKINVSPAPTEKPPTEKPTATSKPISPSSEPSQSISPTSPDDDDDDSDSKHKKKIMIIVGISASVVFVICIIIISVYCCKNKSNQNLNDQKLLITTY